MKNVVTGVIGGYIAIGLALMVAQSMVVARQPECFGTASEPLWEGGRGRTVIRWLPDIFTNVVRGDLGVAGYLRAGHVCQMAVLRQPNAQPPASLDIIPRDGDGSLTARILDEAAGSTTVSEERLPAWALSLEQQQRLLDAADRSLDAALAEWKQFGTVDITGGESRAATEEEVERLIEALRRSRDTDFGIANALPDLGEELPGARIGWYRDRAYQAGTDAIAANKKLIMVVGDDWCDYCNTLIEDVLRCPEVERFAGTALFSYGRPSRDAQSAGTARDLHVTEYPAVFFTTVEEKTVWVHHKIVGTIYPEELEEKLSEFIGEPTTSVDDAWTAAQGPGFHDPPANCR